MLFELREDINQLAKGGTADAGPREIQCEQVYVIGLEPASQSIKHLDAELHIREVANDQHVPRPTVLADSTERQKLGQRSLKFLLSMVLGVGYLNNFRVRSEYGTTILERHEAPKPGGRIRTAPSCWGA